MEEKHPPQFRTFFSRRLSVLSGIFAIAVGGIVLVGWVFDVPELKSILPGFATMKPNTAVSFVLLGTALFFLSPNQKFFHNQLSKLIARICALTAALIGSIVIAEYISKVDIGIDTLLFERSVLAEPGLFPGKMSPITAFNFLILGTSLAILSTDWKNSLRYSQFLSFFVILVSVCILFAFTYGVDSLYEVFPFVSVALHTSVTFFVLSIGILFVRGFKDFTAIFTSQTAGGSLARRLVPVALVLPFVLGWVRLAGEKAGLYKTEFGSAFFAASFVALLLLVIWRTAISLDKSEIDKIRTESDNVRLAAIVEFCDDAVISQTFDGEILSWNAGAENLFGYSKDEAVGKSIEILLPLDLVKEGRLIQSKIRNGDRIKNFETVRVRKDGTEIPISLTLSPIKDPHGNAIAISKIARDITEQKQSEKIIRESKANFEALIMATTQVVWSADENGEGLELATWWQDITGQALADTEGWNWLDAVHPEDREITKAAWTKALTDKTIFDVEYRVRNSAEVYQHFAVRGVPVFDRDNVFRQWIGTFTDITERKKGEEDLLATEEQLRQSQKLESIGKLAGGIAHDFNNLLTVINGYSDLALRDLNLDDPLRKKFDEIKKAGDRAAKLTQQLLAFSRKQVLQPKILILNSVFSEFEEILRRIIGEDVVLKSILENDLGKVKADPNQIEQVIMNLIVNARDAMPQGGQLTIETKNVFLDEKYVMQHSAVVPGEYVMLSVSDTGAGMDKETVNKIFEPFFTTKAPGKGTGLGLSTVYGIIKQSGGNVWVYSEVGKGTTIKVYLPRVVGDEQIYEKGDITTASIFGTETILLAEDEDLVRTLTREVLENFGYKVHEVESGDAAMAFSEKYKKRIDLLITDVVMPGMSGKQLAERLLNSRPEIKVLYMSGYTENTIIHHGILDEDINFIQKPFGTDSLAKIVREILDMKISDR